MDNTKKGKTTPTKSDTYNQNKKAVTLSKSEVLYFDIANSVHGVGEIKGIITNNDKEDEEGIIDIELCQWKIPSVNKKENCEPQKCVPPPPSAPTPPAAPEG